MQPTCAYCTFVNPPAAGDACLSCGLPLEFDEVGDAGWVARGLFVQLTPFPVVQGPAAGTEWQQDWQEPDVPLAGVGKDLDRLVHGPQDVVCPSCPVDAPHVARAMCTDCNARACMACAGSVHLRHLTVALRFAVPVFDLTDDATLLLPASVPVAHSFRMDDRVCGHVPPGRSCALCAAHCVAVATVCQGACDLADDKDPGAWEVMMHCAGCSPGASRMCMRCWKVATVATARPPCPWCRQPLFV